MDIYSLTVDALLNLDRVTGWSELRERLCREAARKPQTWRLPVLGCEAVGGPIQQALPGVAAIACMQIAIILIDDLLDEDPRGEYRHVGPGAAANLAIACQALGLEAVAQCPADPAVKLAAIRSLNGMMLTTAFGQRLDAQNAADEAAYWHVVRSKSSPFYGAALRVGALLGGAPADIAESVKPIGELYGEMVQIHDDLNDALAVPANADWAQGRYSLPILFASTVNHPDRARFEELRGAVSDPNALTEAQTILVRCGAVAYCVHEALQRYQAAREALAGMALAYSAGLEELLESAIKPVWSLLGEAGVNQPEALRV